MRGHKPLVLLELLVLLAAGLVGTAGSAHALIQFVPSWPEFHSGNDHTGSTFEAVLTPKNAKDLARRWTHASLGDHKSSPVLADYLIFDANENGDISALNSRFGDVMWSTHIDGTVESTPAVESSLLSIFDKRVYVSTGGPGGEGRAGVVALNEGTGHEVWTSPVLDSAVLSSPTPWNDVVYVGSTSNDGRTGTLYALDSTTGGVIWSFNADAPIAGSPTISPITGAIFVGAGNRILALDPDSHLVLWSRNLSGFIEGTPTFDGPRNHDRLFVATSDGHVYGLDPSTGSVKWSSAIDAITTSSPAAFNGLIYVGTSSGTLYALSETSGKTRWTYPTGAAIESSPAAAPGLVVFTADTGNVYVLNNRSGRLLWSQMTTANVSMLSSPAIGDGFVDVGSGDGSLYAYVGDQGSAPNYVALGDSYSSGEGVVPFFRDGYDPNTGSQPGNIDNRCHRSTRVYAEAVKPADYYKPLYVLASGGGKPGSGKRVNKYGSDQNVRFGNSVHWALLACSEATSLNVLSAHPADGSDPGIPQNVGAGFSEPYTQIDNPALNSDTDLVTLTIGGNDLHFVDVLTFCFHSPDCTTHDFKDPDTGETLPLAQYLRNKRDELSPHLDSIFAEIHAKSPHAEILLLGYPQLFPATPAEQNCKRLAQHDFPRLSVGYSQTEQNYLRQAASELNQTLAARAEASGVATFVPVDSSFAGHEPCTSSGKQNEWINGPSASFKQIPPVEDGSFHPNLAGQALGYAAAVNAVLDPQSP